jgi:hypothetical protein
MSKRQQMARLSQLADLILDVKLTDLHAAARARQESLDRLAGLAAAPATDLPEIAAAQAGLLYERWAEARRAEINLSLARQTAAWLDLQAEARQAFGRSEVMQTLRDRSKT